MLLGEGEGAAVEVMVEIGRAIVLMAREEIIIVWAVGGRRGDVVEDPEIMSCAVETEVELAAVMSVYGDAGEDRTGRAELEDCIEAVVVGPAETSCSKVDETELVSLHAVEHPTVTEEPCLAAEVVPKLPFPDKYPSVVEDS